MKAKTVERLISVAVVAGLVVTMTIVLVVFVSEGWRFQR